MHVQTQVQMHMQTRFRRRALRRYVSPGLYHWDVLAWNRWNLSFRTLRFRCFLSRFEIRTQAQMQGKEMEIFKFRASFALALWWVQTCTPFLCVVPVCVYMCVARLTHFFLILNNFLSIFFGIYLHNLHRPSHKMIIEKVVIYFSFCCIILLI